jgi:DNA-binding response OmpR family regulator
VAACVLVVEPDRYMRVAMETALELAGFEAIGAVDGQQALRLARLTFPDAIVLDAQLSDLDGPSVIRALGRFEFEIPTVLHSAAPDAPSVAAATDMPVVPTTGTLAAVIAAVSHLVADQPSGRSRTRMALAS